LLTSARSTKTNVHVGRSDRAEALSLLNDAFEQIRAATTGGTQPSPATSLAGLLVILAATHFLFDTTPLNQLAESTDRFLNRFAVANIQLNHASSFGSRWKARPASYLNL